jgi:arylsulfatase
LQYFTTSGNRAIYKDGWWAGNRFHSTWESNFYANATDQDIDARPWELYNLNEEFSQAHNLAGEYPDKLKELLRVFDEEAPRNHAYPILPTRSSPLDAKLKDKTVFPYRAGVERVPLRYAPGLRGHKEGDGSQNACMKTNTRAGTVSQHGGSTLATILAGFIAFCS